MNDVTKNHINCVVLASAQEFQMYIYQKCCIERTVEERVIQLAGENR